VELNTTNYPNVEDQAVVNRWYTYVENNNVYTLTPSLRMITTSAKDMTATKEYELKSSNVVIDRNDHVDPADATAHPTAADEAAAPVRIYSNDKSVFLMAEVGDTDASGGKVITDSFPTNNSDFNSYLNKAKAEGADVIFTPVSIAYATQIITQAQSLGITAPFLGSDTLDDNMVLDAANGTDIQLYVSTFYQEGGAPAFDEGIKSYINSNSSAKDANGGNDTIAAVTAMGYDAYYVALEAMKAAGSADPAAIKAALSGVTYTGVSGDIAFDSTGDAVRDTAYIKHSTNAGAWELETVQKAS